jgi:hypothetical protein
LEEILGPSSSAVIKKAEQEEEDDGGLYFVYNSLTLFSFEEFVDDNGTHTSLRSACTPLRQSTLSFTPTQSVSCE